MTKEELLQYTPLTWREGTATFEAVLAHFTQGLTINEAAREFRIHRVTVAQAVRTVKDAMDADGWKSKYVRRIYYYK